MPEFDEKPAEIENEIKISSYQSLRNSRRADIPLKVICHHLRLNPNLPRADASWLLTKFYGRLAAPWTCLVVVLIAIPFGAASGRRNLFVGVAGSIFICFAYFVIQQVEPGAGLRRPFARVAGGLAAQYDFWGDGPGADGAGAMNLSFNCE